MNLEVLCEKCGSSSIRIPALRAPEGYVIDASLVLVRCGHCEHTASLADCTFSEAQILELRRRASRDLYGTEPF